MQFGMGWNEPLRRDFGEKQPGGYEDLAMLMGDTVLRVGRGAEVAYVNGCQGAWGARLSEKIELGRSLYEFLPASISMRLSEAIGESLETRQVQTFTFQHLIEGESHEYEARLQAIDEQHFWLLVTELTERRRMEKEILEISNREQQRIGQIGRAHV